MNILLVNDDGIDSLGIKLLEEVLQNYGNVYVFAPKEQQSGKACSINAFIGINVNKIDERHYSVIGSPVDCVEAGYAFLNGKIDLVVSGCNSGFNLSHDIMYSGTCGACFQASLAKIPSIAFSCENSTYFHLIPYYVPLILDFVFKHDLLNTHYFLNANFPSIPDVKEIVISKVYSPIYEEFYPILIDSLDNKYIIERKQITKYENDDFDVNVIKNNKISITPLSQSLFDEKIYKEILKKSKKNI